VARPRSADLRLDRTAWLLLAVSTAVTLFYAAFFGYLWRAILGAAPSLAPLLPALKDRNLWNATVNVHTVGIFMVYVAFLIFGAALLIAPARRVDSSTDFDNQSNAGEPEQPSFAQTAASTADRKGPFA